MALVLKRLVLPKTINITARYSPDNYRLVIADVGEN